MSDEIDARIIGSAGVLRLNRPRALHALNLGMVEAMNAALLEWRENPAIAVVLIDHAGERGFCAGGDVAAVRRSVLEDGGAAGRTFFMAEYRLNHLLFTFAKPVVAFMDGITMGGGVGIAMPAKYRIATENTLFAMPEAAIGLFPDVGAGCYLSRLPGRLGPFLALTGARLDGAECLWAGLATHYVPSDRLEAAREELFAYGYMRDAGEILAELAVDPPEPRLARNIERIDRLFASDRLEEILAALEADPSDWAAKELKTLHSKSPLTMKVALRQIAQAKRRPGLDPGPLAGRTDSEASDPGLRRDDEAFAEEMRIEYRLASRIIIEPDFAEGVRAVLVDKDNTPRWNPATPEGISEEKLDELFAPLPPDQEWTPL